MKCSQSSKAVLTSKHVKISLCNRDHRCVERQQVPRFGGHRALWFGDKSPVQFDRPAIAGTGG